MGFYETQCITWENMQDSASLLSPADKLEPMDPPLWL